MPTYEYKCEKCGYRFERFQSMAEEPLKRCPKCRGKIRRLVGAGSGIIFKGSGFHETDYRSETYRESAKREKNESDSKGGDKEDGKTVSSASKDNKDTAKTTGTE